VTDLLDKLVNPHGGLNRWNQLETVSAHLKQGGVTWGSRARKACLTTFSSPRPGMRRVSHHPVGAAGRRSVFTPERVAIQTDHGTVVEELDQPRASFAGQTLETPWTTLQLAYFVGTAMWTFLTQPFSFTLGAPGCSRQARHASQETCPRRSRS
jgi:hypothetical protein